MRLRETIPPWPPRITPSNLGTPVDALVLNKVHMKDHRDVLTPYLCLELKDKAGWLCYSLIFSEDRNYLKGIQKVLGDNAGKTIGELGDVEWPGA